MSASIRARGVSLALGARHILIDADFSVDPGQRVGLVGPNGVGKSTLLHLLSGRLQPDAGTITRTPPNAIVGHVVQEPERTDETVHDHLARRTGVADAQRELDAATAGLAAGTAGADDHYSDALEHWLAIGAADFDSRVGDVWASLGLHERLLQERMRVLSGGEAARVGLAVLQLARFDVLFDATSGVVRTSYQRQALMGPGGVAPWCGH